MGPYIRKHNLHGQVDTVGTYPYITITYFYMSIANTCSCLTALVGEQLYPYMWLEVINACLNRSYDDQTLTVSSVDISFDSAYF